jgi:uncharacterized protein YjbI with pentapeptide repeats
VDVGSLPAFEGPVADEEEIADSQWGGDATGVAARFVSVARCHLLGLQLIGAQLPRLTLTDVLVERADLSGADFDESTFNRVAFHECRLSGAILARCTFRDVRFVGCRMDGVNGRLARAEWLAFEDTDLCDADFYGAELDGTRFFDSDLTRAELSAAHLVGARLHGSTLIDVKGAASLAGAVIQSSQVLPLAVGVFGALGIQIDEERDPPTR